MDRIFSQRAPLAEAGNRSSDRPARFVQLNFYRLVWIFVVTSVAGLLIETLVSYPVDHMWKNRAGLVWGPFSPIYGVGCVIITVALNRFAQASNPALFLIAAVVGAGFEYLAGWFWEAAFGIVAWSYAGTPGNLGDHTCVGMAVVWGAVGLLWMRVLLPRVVAWSEKVPKRWRTRLAAAMTVFLVLDALVTVGAFDCWYERKAGVPPQTPLEQFFDRHYDDAFMDKRFQTMSLYANLANRDDEDGR